MASKDASSNGWFEALRSELAAAVSVSGGILIGSGYGVIWARLHAGEHMTGITPAGVPRETVLSGLPTTFFLATALQSLLVPLFILMTIGVVLAFFLSSKRPLSLWALVGLIIALSSWFAIIALDRFTGALAFKEGQSTALVAAIVACGIVAGIAALLGALVNSRPHASARRTNIRVAGAALLVLIVVAVSGFRLMDGYFSTTPFPIAVILADVTACADPGQSGRCVIAGFYLGQGSDWTYLIPLEPPTAQEKASLEHPFLVVRPRLLQLSTAKVLQIRLASTPELALKPDATLSDAFTTGQAFTGP
jgi:hypothetical protein